MTDPDVSLSSARKARLLLELRALSGASLQKLWLHTPAFVALQLRVPGKTLIAVLDARLGLAALAPARPAAPEGAPTSQATLRRALEGAHFAGARLEAPEGRREPSVRLSFLTPEGPRALVAEPRATALILVAPDPKAGGERIVWAGAGAGVERRPGGPYPAVDEVPLPVSDGEQPARDEHQIVQQALRREEEATLEARRRELVKRLRARAQKLRRTLEAVAQDAARASGADQDRRRAELLLPHQGRIPRGAREAVVPDWSQVDDEGTPAQVTLKLDPALSAAANAQRWLKRAGRYAAAASRIEARRAEVQAFVAAADALVERAAAALSPEALRAVEAEAALPVRGEAPQRRKAAPERLPYRVFRATTGARILVGRSAADNDALTLRWARGNDVWLHARGVQGSHVLLPDAGDAPGAGALAEAALLAAWFSSIRGEEQAEVDWTRRKHVRKQKGAPAGAVLYVQERTVRVRLDPARLQALLATEEK